MGSWSPAPKAVTQRGFLIGSGRKKRPNVMLQYTDIHPWLPADAIH